jgi:hypothetical protein
LQSLKTVAKGSYDQKRAEANQKIRDSYSKSRASAKGRKSVEDNKSLMEKYNSASAEEKAKFAADLVESQTAAASEVDPLDPNK